MIGINEKVVLGNTTQPDSHVAQLPANKAIVSGAGMMTQPYEKEKIRANHFQINCF